MKPPRAAIPAITLKGELNQGYLGEAWLAKENISQHVAFSPNELMVNVHASYPDLLVVNQNFVKGWDAGREIRNYNGLLAIPVEGKETIIFRYVPPFFIAGAFLSFLSALLSLYLWRKPT